MAAYGSFLLVVLLCIDVALLSVAAISYTIFPPTLNRPCANPSASAAPLVSQDKRDTLCRLCSSAVALAWLASWIFFARVMGLIFPMPEMGKVPVLVETGREESASLLRLEVQRPQVGYGRMVAGEAFELGDDED